MRSSPWLALFVTVLAGCGVLDHRIDPTRGSASAALTEDPSRDPPPPPPPPVIPMDTIVPSDPVGYIDGSAGVTPGGEATYSIPLEVPPGRAGMQPALALVYSSHGGNGQLGVGWSLSAGSEIRPCPKTIWTEGIVGGVNYDSQDGLCLDGQKLVRTGVAPDGGAEYRTERETFARVVAYAAQGAPPGAPFSRFIMWTKDGHRHDYDPSPLVDHVQAGDLAPHALSVTTDSIVPVWRLAESRDASGNFIRYSYDDEENGDGLNSFEYRLSKIEYTLSDGGDEAQREIELEYEDRPGDSQFWYQSGVRTIMTRRLRAVHMKYGAVGAARKTYWSYELDYDPSSDTGRSRLVGVKRCDAENVCLWGKRFTWAESGGPAFDASQVSVEEFTEGFFAGSWDSRFVVFDADGDGRDDLLYRHSSSTGWGLTMRAPVIGPLAQRVEVETAMQAQDGFSDAAMNLSRPVDHDGDGVSDLLAKITGGDGIDFRLRHWNPSSLAFDDIGPVVQTGGGLFADFNGDALPDLALASDTWLVGMSDGIVFPPATLLDTGIPVKCRPDARATEVDGDGRADLLVSSVLDGITFACAGSSGAAVNAQDVPFSRPTWGIELGKYAGAIFADVNGDGLKDAVFPSWTSPQIRWNTGAGFGPLQILHGLRQAQRIGIPLVCPRKAERDHTLASAGGREGCRPRQHSSNSVGGVRMRSRKGRTLAEIDAELQANPEWVAQEARREQLRAEKRREHARIEVPVVQALCEAGVEVSSVNDLISTSVPYPKAIPILLEHFQRNYPRWLREGIARSLACKESKHLWPKLLELFEADEDGPTPNGPKWGLGLALMVNADKSRMDELIRLVQDPSHGENRVPLIKALGKLGGDARVLAVLKEAAQNELIAYAANKAIKAVEKRIAAKAPKGHA